MDHVEATITKALMCGVWVGSFSASSPSDLNFIRCIALPSSNVGL